MLVETEQGKRLIELALDKVDAAYAKLTKEHGELIDLNIKAENALNEIQESVDEFCAQCELNSTLTCRECTLYNYL